MLRQVLDGEPVQKPLAAGFMRILLEDCCPVRHRRLEGKGRWQRSRRITRVKNQGRRAESPGLKQPSRCFQSRALCADRAEAEALVNRSWSTAKDLNGFVPRPSEQHSPKEACCRKFLELNVLFQASRDHIPLI